MANGKQRDMYAAERTIPFSVKELEVMCEVTQMTVYLWRKGTPTREPLKTQKVSGTAVRLPVKSTLAWLKRHEIPVFVHPDDLTKPRPAAAPSGQARKPGPKPRAAAVACLLNSERPMARA